VGVNWSVRWTKRASLDHAAIIRWTVIHFGARQATLYMETLALAVAALNKGPELPGCKTRPELGEGIRTLHIARGGRKGRHFIVYRVADSCHIEILRLLHDSMELAGHLVPTLR